MRKVMNWDLLTGVKSNEEIDVNGPRFFLYLFVSSQPGVLILGQHAGGQEK